MYKHIILCLSVCLCGVLCDLNKEEGADCEWEGVKGTCVKETRCLTTLDNRSPKQPVCSKQGEVTIVCCTDCELVNDTRNAVISPTSGLFWKNGNKARDNCLQFIQDKLPYQCRQDGFYGGLKRKYDEEKKCHNYMLWAVGGAPPPGREPSAKYPHQAMLGYGDDLETANWSAGGSIISDRYILTAAHTKYYSREGEPKFVAVNVRNRADLPSSWQTHKVKNFIAHPEYKRNELYHDIALIETETPIKFDKNVLPACLHVEEVNIDHAVATTWRDLNAETLSTMADTIQTIKLEKFSDEECKAAYAGLPQLKEGYDKNIQMCYGSKTNPAEACKGLSGEPLLVNNQFTRCVYTIIGVTVFGSVHCRPNETTIKPDVYTRVSYYVPWIESVVWHSTES